ncbi:hypothetical protein BGZ65_008636 [Modicella reniformis]|uniref:J domain-containing protein n=1 Tax=Modicella reniformis TaxID=1440133 RepID=A0A9P6MAX2_9FUNG|nr:hypothetical protein BGZ65_008636 [Modicella reniformis]
MNHYRHYYKHTGLLTRAGARNLFPSRTLPVTAAITGTSTFHTSVPRESRSSQRNHYERLGLTKDATKKEIKSQFYKLSKLHHPDKTSSKESRAAFLAINDAYSVLRNDRQRRDYDLTLLDKSGSLYSNISQQSSPTRSTLRRTPFRHSAQSAAAAAAAARTHAAFRPQYGHRQSVPHFDSKSHQEMHYEQELRQEERRQARMRASAEYKRQQQFDQSDSMNSKFLKVSFILFMIVLSSSLMRVFADEGDEEDDKGEHERCYQTPLSAANGF